MACCSDEEKAAAVELATVHMHLSALADRAGHSVSEEGTTALRMRVLPMLTSCSCPTVQKTGR